MAHNDHSNHSGGHQEGQPHHHIVPVPTYLAVGVALMVLTLLTVWVAHIDLGEMNFVIAFAIATLKAVLVALIFMGLKYDAKENGLIFACSFIFLAIFIVLTSTDLFFRGDVYVKGPLIAQPKGVSKFKKPWVSTPELIAHGKELFAVQCVACHGPLGHGDGPAASALVPHPRNFTSDQGWSHGRKPSQVFNTISNGSPGTGMAGFGTLPADDRWSLAQFVLSLGPTAPTDTDADLAKIGVNPAAEGAVAEVQKTIPIEVAMARIEVKAPARREAGTPPSGPGAAVYEARCAHCHGVDGQGGIKVKNLGVNPVAYVRTYAFSVASEGLRSPETFDHVVARGLPGDLMPGSGELGASDLRELYGYVKSLASAR
jgi:caa(3)-type oxidase subunit IV